LDRIRPLSKDKTGSYFVKYTSQFHHSKPVRLAKLFLHPNQ
jgi:hypothetical protein